MRKPWLGVAPVVLTLLLAACGAPAEKQSSPSTPMAATPPPAATPTRAAAQAKPAAAATLPATATTQPTLTRPPVATPTPAASRATPTLPSAGSAARPFKLAGAPTWSDGLNGKVDSGATAFTVVQTSGPQPSAKVNSWAPEGDGQAATLGAMDAYIGYVGSRLRGDQGTILLRYKPIPNLAESYAKRHESWTDYGQYKPPQSGFLVDDIGWRGAPKGSFSLVMDPAANGSVAFGIWDGGKWHYVTWKVPQGWQWDSNHWYEVGMTWGPKGQAVLLDGEAKASIPDVVALNTASPWFLGQAPGYWPYGPHTLMGSYDEVRVYAVQPEW